MSIVNSKSCVNCPEGIDVLAAVSRRVMSDSEGIVFVCAEEITIFPSSTSANIGCRFITVGVSSSSTTMSLMPEVVGGELTIENGVAFYGTDGYLIFNKSEGYKMFEPSGNVKKEGTARFSTVDQLRNCFRRPSISRPFGNAARICRLHSNGCGD